jgi:hypothetical protein
MTWAGHVARVREMRKHTIFWSKNLNGRPGHRWEDNIKVGLKIRYEIWTEFIWLSIGSSGGFI